MISEIISRKRLPRWVVTTRDLPARFSVFYGQLVPGRIREYAFIIDRDGAVRFEAEMRHAPHGLTFYDAAPVSHIPPEVLIAAGVEALRRQQATTATTPTKPTTRRRGAR